MQASGSVKLPHRYLDMYREIYQPSTTRRTDSGWPRTLTHLLGNTHDLESLISIS